MLYGNSMQFIFACIMMVSGWTLFIPNTREKNERFCATWFFIIAPWRCEIPQNLAIIIVNLRNSTDVFFLKLWNHKLWLHTVSACTVPL
jgi:hypothetical protein